MTKMIQIRNVPDAVHRQMKSRAALAGMSLSDYLLDALEHWLSLPTEEELKQRLADADPIDMDASSAEMIRKDRDAA